MVEITRGVCASNWRMGKAASATDPVWADNRSPHRIAPATLALRFAMHPLVTQSDKARGRPDDSRIENLTASARATATESTKASGKACSSNSKAKSSTEL